ncbi:winged helix-turn-helix domain-containing protein [Mesorhizobium sp.]|uniref:winged helix-turn-helix domain-containing protein n=1 Tax=Mesorhizobium sp. TaxID=1871066 RepID=UPI000FE7DF05|nr:winged helix-turn-helix domain-containing protein [Mesorhizobium sp.]RWC58893.1 MAG: ArsR family transcriptional regulator [Mesorhizobium sp.]RWC66505.1 MAG: ArsR family transcriptional regulator [Mesorhizobium sp.]
MNARSILDIVQMSIAVPRGEAGYWSIILDLDLGGPWTVREICDRTNVKTQAVGRYVRKLRLAGIAQVVEKKTAKRGLDNVPQTVVYRLVKRPLVAPRISLAGEIYEKNIDRLWRAIKMAKVFSGAEMAALCPDVPPRSVEAYLYALSTAGVLSGTPKRYRLARNVGMQAPKVLATKAVYDPNSKTVIGIPVATEVKS